MDNRFSKLVYELRKEKGWTQSELGERLGLTDKAVSRWENGESYPETAQLVPLSNLFGITVDELLKGERRQNAGAPSGEGTAGASSADGGQDGRRTYAEQWAWQQKAVPPLTTRQAVQVAVGVALILAGVLFIIIAGVVNVPDSVYMPVFFTLLAVSVCIFINMGMRKQLADSGISAELEKTANTYILMISFGVAAMILALCGFFLFDYVVAAICVLFGALIVGIALTIIGGVGWEREVLRKTGSGNANNGATAKPHTRSVVAEKASGVIMLLATAIFLVMGFVWDLWHPGWIVFPVGGILCGVISTIFTK